MPERDDDEIADLVKRVDWERFGLVDVCPMCDETIEDDDVSPSELHVLGESAPRRAHRSCMLREVTGGIGHLIAHEYWCTARGDPDAGLTRRQSARLVDAYVAVLGIERAAER